MRYLIVQSFGIMTVDGKNCSIVGKDFIGTKYYKIYKWEPPEFYGEVFKLGKRLLLWAEEEIQ